MKLAIIRQRYNPYGGAERFVERALAALARQDLDVTLITRRWDGPEGGFKRQVCDPFHVGRTWRDASFARAACATANAGGFDLVQSHEKLPCCDIYRAGDGLHRAWLQRRSRLLGLGSRAWLHLNSFNLYTLAAEKAMFTSSRLKAVICISQLVKREIQESFDLPDERLPVIYNGIDPALFNPGVRLERDGIRRGLEIPLAAPVFLFVGSGYERKGLDRIIKALPREAWLLVVGKDKHEPRYQALAERRGCLPRVRFLGPRKDVRPFYGAADAFAFPAVYEPFGNVILEAMACGLPVVTTPDCGGADLVVEGTNGHICPGGDREALAHALGRLTDTDYARTLGNAAAMKAREFDLARMSQRMVALYQQLLG